MCSLLIKSFPTKTLKNVTPQEAWSGWKLSILHFLVFRSIVCGQVPKKEMFRHDDRSEKLPFIRYDEKSKGYKLFNRSTNKSVISRDIKFNEKAIRDWSTEEEESYNFLSYSEEKNSINHVSETPPTTPLPSPHTSSPSLHSSGYLSGLSEGPKRYILIK